MTSCKPGVENPAPERNFYFTVTSGVTDRAVVCKEYLLKEIPLYKYTITNGSGQEWPFYKALEQHEDISSDSLMPPHWFVHKMVPFNGQSMAQEEFLVDIKVDMIADTLPNFELKIFRKQQDTLVLSAQTGVHFLSADEFKNSDEFHHRMLQHILRYSFK